MDFLPSQINKSMNFCQSMKRMCQILRFKTISCFFSLVMWCVCVCVCVCAVHPIRMKENTFRTIAELSDTHLKDLSITRIWRRNKKCPVILWCLRLCRFIYISTCFCRSIHKIILKFVTKGKDWICWFFAGSYLEILHCSVVFVFTQIKVSNFGIKNEINVKKNLLLGK
jgi:hypothetical protein